MCWRAAPAPGPEATQQCPGTRTSALTTLSLTFGFRRYWHVYLQTDLKPLLRQAEVTLIGSASSAQIRCDPAQTVPHISHANIVVGNIDVNTSMGAGEAFNNARPVVTIKLPEAAIAGFPQLSESVKHQPRRLRVRPALLLRPEERLGAPSTAAVTGGWRCSSTGSERKARHRDGKEKSKINWTELQNSIDTKLLI